jgi:transcriptional regulator with XRE-family HTH domain
LADPGLRWLCISPFVGNGGMAVTDFARSPHSAQAGLKQVMTPIWDRSMGQRLALIRMKRLADQSEFGAVLGMPGHPISKQTLSKVESGRLSRMRTTWARLEAVLGADTAFVLVAKDAAYYRKRAQGIWDRYHDARMRARKRGSTE